MKSLEQHESVFRLRTQWGRFFYTTRKKISKFYSTSVVNGKWKESTFLSDTSHLTTKILLFDSFQAEPSSYSNNCGMMSNMTYSKGGKIHTGENRITRNKTDFNANCQKNFPWTDWGSNTGLHGEMPINKCLTHVVAYLNRYYLHNTYLIHTSKWTSVIHLIILNILLFFFSIVRAVQVSFLWGWP